MTWLRLHPVRSNYGLVFAAALWGLVAAVYLASRRETRGNLGPPVKRRGFSHDGFRHLVPVS